MRNKKTRETQEMRRTPRGFPLIKSRALPASMTRQLANSQQSPILDVFLSDSFPSSLLLPPFDPSCTHLEQNLLHEQINRTDPPPTPLTFGLRPHRARMGASQSVPEKSIHEFTVKVNTGETHLDEVPFSAPAAMMQLRRKTDGVFVGCVVLCCVVEQDSRGKDVDLSAYKGKVLLVVNVASKWYASCQSPV